MQPSSVYEESTRHNNEYTKELTRRMFHYPDTSTHAESNEFETTIMVTQVAGLAKRKFELRLKQYLS